MKVKTILPLLLTLLLLTIMPTTAVSISEATIKLADDNSGMITLMYSLTDRDREILSSESQENLNLAKNLLGLTDDGTGTYSFTWSNMTQYADMDGQPVLLLHGFYFDQLDWRENSTYVTEYPRLNLLSPDFQPDLITIVWPDGRELPFVNVTYIPNMYITL